MDLEREPGGGAGGRQGKGEKPSKRVFHPKLSLRLKSRSCSLSLALSVSSPPNSLALAFISFSLMYLSLTLSLSLSLPLSLPLSIALSHSLTLPLSISLSLVRRATWPNGEWGYINRRHMLEPVRPEAVLPDRASCLPTFSHFLIVNKTSLTHSLSLSLPLCT